MVKTPSFKQEGLALTDFMTPNQRSRTMSRVRGSETKIERTIRSALHEKGYRFRKNVSNLPGHPDIVFPKYKAVIFIHGCFWHGHVGCSKSKLPATRTEFWQKKIARTVERDKENVDELIGLGWRGAIVWECALRNKLLFKDTIDKLESWLRSDIDWVEIPYSLPRNLT